MAKDIQGQRYFADLLDPPFQSHSDTSREAAQSVSECASTLRIRYLEWLRCRADYGATDEEAQEGLPMPASTQRPRRVECVRMLLVKDSGRTRLTRSGRKAVVWVAVAQKKTPEILGKVEY